MVVWRPARHQPGSQEAPLMAETGMAPSNAAEEQTAPTWGAGSPSLPRTAATVANRYLDDAQLDRLLEAAGAEARRRGRRTARRLEGNARKARSGDARPGAADPRDVRSRPQAGGDRPGVSAVARPGDGRGGRREAASPVSGFLECTEAGPLRSSARTIRIRLSLVCGFRGRRLAGYGGDFRVTIRHWTSMRDIAPTVQHATHVAQRRITARTGAQG